MAGRQKRIQRHLTPEELDDAIDEAERTDQGRLLRRLICIRNLYLGATLEQAARRVGVVDSTVSRWTDDWNAAGVDGLRPDFGGGKPSRLSGDQRHRLKLVLYEHQPWTTVTVQRLIEEAFGITYSKRHVRRLLDDYGLGSSIPRSEAAEQVDDIDAVLDESLENALEDLDGGLTLTLD